MQLKHSAENSDILLNIVNKIEINKNKYIIPKKESTKKTNEQCYKFCFMFYCLTICDVNKIIKLEKRNSFYNKYIYNHFIQ